MTDRGYSEYSDRIRFSQCFYNYAYDEWSIPERIHDVTCFYFNCPFYLEKEHAADDIMTTQDIIQGSKLELFNLPKTDVDYIDFKYQLKRALEHFSTTSYY